MRPAKFSELFDANIVGVFTWNRNGHIVSANRAFLRMVGYDCEDVSTGRLQWMNFVPSDSSDHEWEPWVSTLTLHGGLELREKKYVRKDGLYFPVLVGAAALDTGELAGVAFVLDLTEIKQAEAQARENERRLRQVQSHAGRSATPRQIAASIAHEVKQPIASIQMNASAASHWLATIPSNTEEAKYVLRHIDDDSNRANQVIRQIRALSKKGASRYEFADLNEAIGHVSDLVRGEAGEHDVVLKSAFSATLFKVFGDRVQLQQVVLNLIVNAIESVKSTTDGPRNLRISTANHRMESVIISVEDSGVGLPDGGIDRLFEPFYTTKPGGLGMGLSISRSIVEAHGGRMHAMPNIPRGAIFEFTIPARHDCL
jgi:PAS domain S-box-containing protein